MILTTPCPHATSAASQEGQAFKSDVVHEKDVSSTDHTYELTEDDYDYDFSSMIEGEDGGNGNFYHHDLDFVSGKKIHQQEKLCDSSRADTSSSPAATSRKRGCFVGTGAGGTPLDIILGRLESLMHQIIRAGGRGSNKNHGKSILDIDRLITQCYGHLLSSSDEHDIYNDEENGDQGDTAQNARLCHLENIRIDLDRVISKCGLSAVAGDDERLKRLTEEIPDIMRVSRENCNATLYDSIRSLETFLP